MFSGNCVLNCTNLLIALSLLSTLTSSFSTSNDARACVSSEFRCKNERCIPTSWLCDGENDCGDKSDEIECGNRTCRPDEFSCHLNGQCIPQTWVCDGQADCLDESDEKSAQCKNTTACLSRQFSCNNGKCISKNWKCDHEDDCGDNSDEINCPTNTTCSTTDFRCRSGKCIHKQYRCDGDADCPDKDDEEDCLPADFPSSSSCSEGEWACKTGHQCIHINWRCDGSFDCYDKSDEENCTKKCRPDQWQCKSLDCIPDTMRCNGEYECADHSDEENCASHNITTAKPTVISHTCGPDMFRCNGTFKECIDRSEVCNGDNDCGDWSDEPVECGVDECETAHPCSQVCIDDTIGFHCECHRGFRLKNDSRTCEDINECEEIDGLCSGHMCINTQGRFKCECVNGYHVQDYKYCKIASPVKPKLLFTNRHDIRLLSLENSPSHHQYYTSLYQDLNSAIALDYSINKNFIVWSDIADEKIYVGALDSEKESNPSILIDSNVKAVDGLALDWVHNLLYWSDIETKKIEVVNVSAPEQRTAIVTTDLQKPRGIAMNPVDGFIVWSDWGQNPRIEKSQQDGSNRQILVKDDIVWPNGLAIDLIVRRIYWVDAKLSTINAVGFDGRHRKSIVKSNVHLSHPFAIDVFEDYMYWSDWHPETIMRAGKFVVENPEITQLVKSDVSIMDVKVVHPYKQPLAKNRCFSASCSHLCLPKGDSYRCACPMNYILSSNNSTCVPSPTSPPTRTPVPHSNSKPTSASSLDMTLHSELPQNDIRSTGAENHTPHKNKTYQRTSLFTRNTSLLPSSALGSIQNVTESDKNMAVTVIAIFVILTSFIAALTLVVYRNYQRRQITALNFDNPVYRKTTEEQFVLEKSDDIVSSYPSSMEPLTSPGTNEFV